MAVTRLTTNGLSGTKYDIASADNYYMEPIATTLLGSAAANVTFSNIPQNYKHLQIRYIVRSTQAATETGINARLNSDTGSNYAWHYLFGDGASVAAGAGATQTSINLVNVAGNSATASAFAVGVLDVLDYANTNKYKTLRLLQGWDGNGAGRVNFSSGLWMNTSPNSTIELYPSSGNWAANSRFSLFGIKG